MKRLFTIIAMTMFMVLVAIAQDNKLPRFNPEEFRAKLETYIAQKANLTQAECDKVFPIYRELKEKQRKLKTGEMKLKKNCAGYDNDKEFQEAIEDVAKLRIEAAKLEESYYKKMCKVIPAKKVYAITMAEDAFHREMLQRFNNKQRKHHPN